MVNRYIVRPTRWIAEYDDQKWEQFKELNYNTLAEVKEWCAKYKYRLVKADKQAQLNLGHLYYIQVPKETINHEFDVNIGYLA